MLIILITLDCVRKSHFNEDYAPQFFKNREEWVSFENAFSQSQNTLSSHFTMFTSNYLMEHKVYSNFSPKKLPPHSFDRHLRNKGFETKAICGVSFLANLLGNQIGEKDSGFDFEGDSIYRKLLRKFSKERRCAYQVFKRGMSFLSKSKSRDIFLWLHLFDAHMPYFSPDRFRNFKIKKSEKSVKEQIDEKGWFSPYFKEYEKKLDLSYFPQCYKSAISYIDDEMNNFFMFLKSKNIFDESLIFVTADHGECLLGDHNIYCAHKKLFDDTINIPLFVKFPQKKFSGEKVFEIVEHLDIAPTVVSKIGLEEENFRGQDLFKFLNGKGKNKEFSFSEHVDNFMQSIRNDRYIYSEVVENVPNKWGMKMEDAKLFTRNGSEVKDKNIESIMKVKMDELIKEIQSSSKKEEDSLYSDKKIEEQLKSLGYL